MDHSFDSNPVQYIYNTIACTNTLLMNLVSTLPMTQFYMFWLIVNRSHRLHSSLYLPMTQFYMFWLIVNRSHLLHSSLYPSHDPVLHVLAYC